jgi:murein DD-endopeptidase MepM/ murein hydrolase activator NlpD
VGIGLPFQIRISSVVDFGSVEVTWLERTVELPLERDGERFTASLLLGSDVKKQSPGERTLRLRAEKFGKKQELQQTIRVHERTFPVQRLSLPKRMVSLSQKTLKRYRKEKQEIGAALSTYRDTRSWSCPFQRPAQGKISSRYGLRRILNDKPRSPHRGLDLRTGAGARVKACNHGRVRLIANHYFSGNSIYIDHGRGLVSMYFHLSKTLVSQGQEVAKGEVIGLTGSTGRATGPHLHFGVSVLGQLVDPAYVLEQTCPDQ